MSSSWICGSHRKVAGLPLFVIATFASSANNAQEAASPAIEETIVTAQRIEEDLQDVPLSVAVLTGEQLDERGIQRIADLASRIPNVLIAGDPGYGPTGGSFTIRGIPDVLNYVDGVYGFWHFGSMAREVIEVERIEVLRGPQGTLFGKDATGGAIQYITKPPADDFGVRASAVSGSYDRRDVTAAVDWPLSDTVRTKWTGAHLQRDGFVDSALIDRSFGDFDDDVLRGDLLWKPSDAFRLRFNIENNDYRANGQPRITPSIYDPQPPFSRAQVYLWAGVPFSNLTNAAGFPGGELGKYQSRSVYQHDGWKLEENRAVLDLEWDISDHLTLKSITGDFDVVDDTSVDPCSCELNTWFLRSIIDTGIESQELQLRGNGDRVRWLAGIYYYNGHYFEHGWFWQFKEFRDDPDLLAQLNQVVPLVPPGNFDLGFTGNPTGSALFGQVAIRLGAKSQLTIGLRHSDEEDTIAVPTFPYTVNDAVIGGDPTGPIDVYDANLIPSSFDHDAPRASFEHAWNDRLMTYVSYAEGFNSGGVNVPGVPELPETIPYGPETVKTTEIGLRSEWWNRRLRLNATLFSTDWIDIQVPVFLPDPSTGIVIPIDITVNAAAAAADGAERRARRATGRALASRFRARCARRALHRCRRRARHRGRHTVRECAGEVLLLRRAARLGPAQRRPSHDARRLRLGRRLHHDAGGRLAGDAESLWLAERARRLSIPPGTLSVGALRHELDERVLLRLRRRRSRLGLYHRDARTAARSRIDPAGLVRLD